MKLLTISIAAYNVEKYLKQTLDSLVDERYVDRIEILVIDDGSKDNTSKIAKEYQELFPKSIVYVPKDNGGHGSTINKGIKLAKGKYFRVIDGDDYVDQDAFSEFIVKLESCETDIILTDLRAVDDKGNKRIDPGVLENGKNPFDDIRENELYDLNEGACTRIFGLSTVTIKTELLQSNNVRITEKCFYVDVEFIIWCIYLSKDFVFWRLPVYMYRKDPKGDNSVSKSNMIKNVGMQEKVALKLCHLYEDFYVNIKEGKRMLIVNRIAISVGAAMRTYMLLEKYAASKENIIRFDKETGRYPNAYRDLNSNKFIYLVRVFNYFLLPFIRVAYRAYSI